MSPGKSDPRKCYLKRQLKKLISPYETESSSISIPVAQSVSQTLLPSRN